MPFEQARQRLMSQTVEWGAPPPNRSHTAPATVPPESGTTTPLSSTRVHNATTTSRMEYVVEDAPRSKIFVSSKDWTVDALLQQGPSFKKVARISITEPLPKLRSAIEFYERSGRPLIIEGWHNHQNWPKDIFTVDWFRDNGQQEAQARNVHDWTDINIPIHELIRRQRAIPTSIAPGETERLYGKDAHCPEAWSKWLNDSGVIPSSLLPESSENLLQCVPEAERVETLMCYLGIGDTFTPCHKDLCASSGQNIMCYTENGGSSFWFMTESSSAPDTSEYFHKLGQELDLETHVITLEELQKAPFTVYIAEQKLGDMVLVPPRSCHQVVNHGGITIKMSWSRMTLDGLATAFYHELPIYRRVCRTETYRVKYTIYHTLLRYTRDLKKYIPLPSSSAAHDSRLLVSSSRDEAPALSTPESCNKLRLIKALRRLIDLFDDVLVEDFCKDHDQMSHMTTHAASADSSNKSSDCFTPSTTEGISRVTCDFCDTDVFQSFFECRKCVVPPVDEAMETGPAHEVHGDGLVICPSCYVEGRTCRCEIMQPTQCRPFNELLCDRNMAMKVLEQVEKSRTRKYIILTERHIISEQRLSVFEAACAIHRYYQSHRQIRNVDKMTRVCTRGREAHNVLRDSLLRCKRCHSSLCFDHILHLGVHSAEAILVSQSDSSDGRWHDRHKDKLLFTQARPQVVQAEKDGGRCDVRHKMVITANNFNTCMPTNPTFTKPGWYDKFVQSSNIPTEDSEKHAIEDTIEDTVADSEVIGSPLTDLSDLLSLPSSPTFGNPALPGVDEETSSGSDTEERPPLSMGDELHLSVRPTGMTAILPEIPYLSESATDSQQSPSSANTLAVINPVPGKKRKRQVLDFIMVPSLPKAARSSIAKTAKESTTSPAKRNGKYKERDGSPQNSKMRRSPYHTEPSPADAPPSLGRSLSRPKGSPLKSRWRRIVNSSRENTPIVVAPPAIPRLLDEDTPPKKRARFRAGPSSLRTGEMSLSSTSSSHQQKVDTTATGRGTPHPSASFTSNMPASMPGTITQANDRMYRPGRQLVPIGETPEEVAHSVSQSGPLHLSEALGSSNPPSALNRSGSQAIVQPPRPVRLMEKKFDALVKRCDQQQEQYNRLEKQYNALVKHTKSQDRKIQRYEDRLKDRFQRFESDQEDYANQMSKVLRDISAIREDTEQQISRVHKQSSEMRADVGEIRSRITENFNGNPATSTHIVVGAESITRLLTSTMHNNGGPQFGQKYKGHPQNRSNHQPHRQFHTPPSKFEGRHHMPGPNRFRSEGVRGNNDVGWQPPSMPPPQNYPHGNGNKYNMGNSDRLPSDQSFQFNRSGEGRTADPPRQPDRESQLPVRKRRWGPRLNDPNGIEVSPTAPSPDNAKVGERTHVVDSAQSLESAVPLSMTTTNQDTGVRSQSPSDFWEDDYDRDDDDAPTGEASGSSSAPGEGTITAVHGDVVEQNPWASP